MPNCTRLVPLTGTTEPLHSVEAESYLTMVWLIELILNLLGFPDRRGKPRDEREAHRERMISLALVAFVVVLGLALWFLLPKML